jgi:DNA-binding NarL/FixJ family response regulator
VIRAVDAGAMGFMSKRASNQALFDALTNVMTGGILVPTMAVGGLLTPFDAPEGSVTVVAGSVHAHAIEQAPQKLPSLAELGLTPRQRDVLALLLQGKPNKLIARELNVSVETVKDHVAAVLRALNVNSRTQAVLAVGQMSQQGGVNAWRPGGQ